MNSLNDWKQGTELPEVIKTRKISQYEINYISETYIKALFKEQELG